IKSSAHRVDFAQIDCISRKLTHGSVSAFFGVCEASGNLCLNRSSELLAARASIISPGSKTCMKNESQRPGAILRMLCDSDASARLRQCFLHGMAGATRFLHPESTTERIFML